MITHRRTLDQSGAGPRDEHLSSNRNTAYAVATYTPDFDQTAETAINRLEEQAITRSLKTLSPTQREAINLVYSDELIYQQVGADLGLPYQQPKPASAASSSARKAVSNTPNPPGVTAYSHSANG